MFPEEGLTLTRDIEKSRQKKAATKEPSGSDSIMAMNDLNQNFNKETENEDVVE